MNWAGIALHIAAGWRHGVTGEMMKKMPNRKWAAGLGDKLLCNISFGVAAQILWQTNSARNGDAFKAYVSSKST